MHSFAQEADVLTEKTILDSRKEAMALNPLLIAQSQAVSPFLFSSYSDAPLATNSFKINWIEQVNILLLWGVDKKGNDI